MKATDDYSAKVRFWAQNPRVVALPPGTRLPKFRPQKFATHKEMNVWKQRLILEAAREHVAHG